MNRQNQGSHQRSAAQLCAPCCFVNFMHLLKSLGPKAPRFGSAFGPSLVLALGWIAQALNGGRADTTQRLRSDGEPSEPRHVHSGGSAGAGAAGLLRWQPGCCKRPGAARARHALGQAAKAPVLCGVRLRSRLPALRRLSLSLAAAAQTDAKASRKLLPACSTRSAAREKGL